MERKEKIALGNLLALVHRDGGHYQGKHGTLKAILDAENVIAAMKNTLASMETYAKKE